MQFPGSPARPISDSSEKRSFQTNLYWRTNWKSFLRTTLARTWNLRIFPKFTNWMRDAFTAVQSVTYRLSKTLKPVWCELSKRSRRFVNILSSPKIFCVLLNLVIERAHFYKKMLFFEFKKVSSRHCESESVMLQIFGIQNHQGTLASLAFTITALSNHRTHR